MRPAEITLHIVHNIARLALALVLANAHAVQAGQITVRHTLSALAIPVVARRAFARVGRYATSAIFAGSVKEKLQRQIFEQQSLHLDDTHCSQTGSQRPSTFR